MNVRYKRITKKRKVVSVCLWEVLLLILGFIFLLPFIWMVRTALMSGTQASKFPPEWIPKPFIIENFTRGLQMIKFDRFFKNSLIVTILSVIGTVVSSTMVGFAFARLKARGKKFLFVLLLSTMMIPGTVTLIPMFVLYSRMHWIDTYIPLILPCFLGGGAFNIFLMRQFFMAIPKELGESAMIDGCGWGRIFAQIYLPNAKPAILVVTLLSFVGVWNDYFAPMIYLTNPAKYTMALGLAVMKNQYGGSMNMGPMMAMAFLGALPILAMYLAFQKYFVQGVVTSGIKG